MNELEKKAEQLFDDIRMLRGHYDWRLAKGENKRAFNMKKLATDLILQFATEVAEMQRSACVQQYYDSDNKHGTLATIADTPLVTETNTEK